MQVFYPPPEYHTPVRRAAWRYRLLPLPTTVLLSDLFFKLMLPGWWRARRGRHSQEDVAVSCARFGRFVEDTGARMHITGMEVLSERPGAAVFVCNHMGTLETFVLPGIIYPFKPTTLVIKDSILRQPIFGPIMAAMAPIAVTRSDPRADLKKVLDEGIATLQAGVSMIIFPQTTRTPIFDPAEFNSLGEKLAKRAGVPVVPVAAKTDFWVPGKRFKDIGRVDIRKDVHFAFGPAFDATVNPQQLHAQIVGFIMARLKEWQLPVVER